MTSIVANGCLLDNQKEVFTFWYKIGKKSTRKLSNIFDDFSVLSILWTSVLKCGQKRTRRIPNNEFYTLSVKLQPILTERRFFGFFGQYYWTIQITVGSMVFSFLFPTVVHTLLLVLDFICGMKDAKMQIGTICILTGENLQHNIKS